MDKRRITVNFYGFWYDFDYRKSFIYRILSKRYDVCISDNPEYAFVSCYDNDYRFLSQCTGVRIFYTGECVSPDFTLFDYAIGFDYISFGDRYFRLPTGSNEPDMELFAERKHENVEGILAEKDLFCTFMYSHEGCKERTELFQALSEYKRVESVGKYLNNSDIQIPYEWDQGHTAKRDFQKRAKFVLAIENTSYPGYSTEKILHAFASQSIPIYYGDPEIGKEYNEGAFINCHNYNSWAEVVEAVKKVDSDDELYMKMLRTPAFVTEGYAEQRHKACEEFLYSIIDQDYEKAFRRPRSGYAADHNEALAAMWKYKEEALAYREAEIIRQNKKLLPRAKRVLKRMLKRVIKA